MIEVVREKHHALLGELDEKARRVWAASEAMALGYGGISAVAKATGMAISTIRIGIQEIQEIKESSAQTLILQEEAPRRVRRVGGGRKPLTSYDPTLVKDLEALVSATIRGDPISPLRWTCKSTRVLAGELKHKGHSVTHASVGRLLRDLGYSLQGAQKTKEGSSHPDRDAQFKHINAQVEAFQIRGQPVISVDTKKKELVGDFKNGGQEWRPTGAPEKVRVHDFIDKELGKAIPYGVYDVTKNQGWVTVGIDHDTGEFAVETIRQWWRQMGSRTYPDANELLIMADSGGSNGSRVRLWKVRLQELADELGLRISVCHFPPGTSKWNKIEHRMFCHITRNWRSRPLESLEVIVNLIGHTRTEQGLRIQAGLDTGNYPKGIKVTDKEMARLHIQRDSFHGNWNYSIFPR